MVCINYMLSSFEYGIGLQGVTKFCPTFLIFLLGLILWRVISPAKFGRVPEMPQYFGNPDFDTETEHA